MCTSSSERSNDHEAALQGGWRESDGHRMKGCKTNSRVSAIMEAAEVAEIELQQERSENGVKQEDKTSLEEKASKKPQPSVPFYKLFCFANSFDYVLMALGTIGACVHGAAIPVFFIFFGKLINAFGSNYNNPTLMAKEVAKYALYFFYLGLIVLGAAWLEVSCWMQSGERQSAQMRLKYLKAMLSQDVGYFDTDTSTGEIVNRISSDTILVQDAISEKAGNYIHYMARFFAGFAVGFFSVWQLTLVTLAVVPAIALAGGLYAVVMVGLTSKSQKAYTKAGEIAEEAISQIRTVYSFVGEAKACEQYSKALETTMQLGKRGGLAKGLGVGSTYGLLFGAWALLLWYAGILVRHGITNGGQAFTTILNVVISGIALGQAAPNLTAFGKAKAAGYNILEMINRIPAIDHNNIEGKILEKLQGQIEFQHVSFNYPSRPDVLIFQDLCLTVPAGKTIAIVGSSGSGKSTVVSLIERFYDPVSGEVLLDGENIKSLQLRWLRGQIGLVNQEPALFATSLLENILYGKENAVIEEVEAAATAANAHHFIEMLPNAYSTQVGERGVQLSGGQKQRIAIARAMLKNPAILLLDEATSALDSSSEHTVQEALDRLMIGRTTVVVAHRLSTVRNVDMIAVLNQGKVVEIGTHNQLISKETGAYASLVRLQDAAPSRQLDGAAISRKMSHGSSLSQRNFSFRAGMASETDSGSLCMDFERSQQLMNIHRPSTMRLLRLNFPEWPFAVLGSLGAIMAGVETPLFALAISQVLVTFYFPDKEYIKKEVQKYALIFSGATVATVLIYLLQHYFFGIMGERLTRRVREKMFAAILENEVGWFDYEENNSSLVCSRLASDATLVRAAVGDRMSTIIQNISLATTSFIISFILDWRVTLVIIACFPLIIGAAICEQLFLKGFGGDLGKAYSRASMVAGEAVSNIRTVAAFCAEQKVLDLFSLELDSPKKRTVVRGQLSGFGYGISQFFMFSSYGLALWYASTLVRDNKTSFGKVMKAFMVLIMTAFGIAETLALAPDIIKGSRALSFIFEIMDRKTAINPDDPRAQEVVSVKGEIELRHVEFAYPARPDAVVFHDLSLKVHAGRSLALVGSSGSGKSSVIALIARLYDPLRGRVMVDGKDIKRLKLRSLRRHIGLVQQEPALFATTIYNNILYGKDGATEAEIVEAAKAANAHNFISALPNGYQTDVGERGVQLSGGQKQRVAIARAVLKDPAILLLDEATSALDAESEKIVQAALDRLMRGRTTVMVAHRLSTVRNANTIAVLQDGLIIEHGKHLELMSKINGVYVQLVSMQQQQQQVR